MTISEISPPDPIRVGEGRPAAMTSPGLRQGGGGRLIPVFHIARSRCRERTNATGYVP